MDNLKIFLVFKLNLKKIRSNLLKTHMSVFLFLLKNIVKELCTIQYFVRLKKAQKTKAFQLHRTSVTLDFIILLELKYDLTLRG